MLSSRAEVCTKLLSWLKEWLDALAPRYFSSTLVISRSRWCTTGRTSDLLHTGAHRSNIAANAAKQLFPAQKCLVKTYAPHALEAVPRPHALKAVPPRPNILSSCGLSAESKQCRWNVCHFSSFVSYNSKSQVDEDLRKHTWRCVLTKKVFHVVIICMESQLSD